MAVCRGIPHHTKQVLMPSGHRIMAITSAFKLMMRVRFPLPAPVFTQKPTPASGLLLFFDAGESARAAKLKGADMERRHRAPFNTGVGGLLLLQLAAEAIAFAMDGGDDLRVSPTLSKCLRIRRMVTSTVRSWGLSSRPVIFLSSSARVWIWPGFSQKCSMARNSEAAA